MGDFITNEIFIGVLQNLDLLQYIYRFPFDHTLDLHLKFGVQCQSLQPPLPLSLSHILMFGIPEFSYLFIPQLEQFSHLSVLITFPFHGCNTLCNPLFDRLGIWTSVSVECWILNKYLQQPWALQHALIVRYGIPGCAHCTVKMLLVSVFSLLASVALGW